MHQVSENASVNGLAAEIRRRIDEQGGITFAEFMGHCLYHPQYGYYMTPRVRIGKEGDFFTSTSVHALFGRLIARQLRQMWELLGQGPFTVVEQGPGEGHLCLDILDAASTEPEFYRQLRYLLVEVSPDHRQRQERLLAGHAERVAWRTLEEVSGVRGCFLSNELIDAFPVHLVERRDGELREVYVVKDGDGFAEELRPPSTPELQAYFLELGIELAEGNRAEVSLAAPAWMREVAGRLDRGFVLTIDYGYPAEELLAPWRRSGTLMCYRKHTAGEDPFAHPGEQDITTHVDFTTLQRAGEEEGLASLWFGPQYRFLMALGFVEALLELQAQTRNEQEARALRLTLKNLIMPEGGMGETFKVLVQGKGVGHPQLLCHRPVEAIRI